MLTLSTAIFATIKLHALGWSLGKNDLMSFGDPLFGAPLTDQLRLIPALALITIALALRTRTLIRTIPYIETNALKLDTAATEGTTGLILGDDKAHKGP